MRRSSAKCCGAFNHSAKAVRRIQPVREQYAAGADHSYHGRARILRFFKHAAKTFCTSCVHCAVSHAGIKSINKNSPAINTRAAAANRTSRISVKFKKTVPVTKLAQPCPCSLRLLYAVLRKRRRIGIIHHPTSRKLKNSTYILYYNTVL